MPFKTNLSLLGLSLLILQSLILQGCSFKKGTDSDKLAPTNTTLIEQPKAETPAGPKTIFDALNSKDQAVFTAYLDHATQEEINSYDAEGLTPLYVASRLANLNFVEALLAKKAIVLQPNKNSKESAYSLAMGINDGKGGIAQVLKENLNIQKAIIAGTVRNGSFASALGVIQTQYLPLAEKLNDQSTFLDLLLKARVQNPLEAEQVVLKILPQITFDNAQAGGLWSLAFERQSIPLLASLSNFPHLIEVKALTDQLERSPISWTLNVLKYLNAKSFVLKLDPVAFQMKYLDDVYAGKEIDLAKLKTDIALISFNSNSNVICSSCVQRVLSENSFRSSRAEIAKILIENAQVADPDFIPQLVGAVQLSELRVILGAMKPAQIAAQKNSILVLAMNADSKADLTATYSLLKENGIKFSSEEGFNILSLQVNEYLNGSDRAANIIKALAPDLIFRRNEQFGRADSFQSLASKLVLNLSNSNIEESLELVRILQQINGPKFDSILLDVGESEAKRTLRIDATYFAFLLANTAHARVDKNSILSLKDSLIECFTKNEEAVSFTITEPTFALGLAMQTIERVVKLSRYELIMYSALIPNFDEQQLKSFELTSLEKTIQPLLINRFYSDIDGAILLSNEARRTLSFADLARTRKIFLPMLLSINQSEATKGTIQDYINEMKPDFSNSEGSNSKDFLKILLADLPSIADEQIIKLFKIYLKKQNPRLYVALSAGKLAEYKSFLHGDFKRDPLCNHASANIEIIQSIYGKIGDTDEQAIAEVCKFFEATKENSSFPTETFDIASIPGLRNGNKGIIESGRNIDLKKLALKPRRPTLPQSDKDWAETLNELLNRLGPERFDKMDIYGLKASDLPLNVNSGEWAAHAKKAAR